MPNGGGTSAAEGDLRWEASAYWFIARAVELYPRRISLWLADIPATSLLRGTVAGFDTGGIVSGRIDKLPPFVDLAERVAYVKSRSLPLTEWLSAFPQYLSDHYGVDFEDARAAYSSGTPPKKPTDLSHSSNHSVAWTWEARIERASLYSGMGLSRHAIVWSDADRRTFTRWLLHTKVVPGPARGSLKRWVDSHGHVSEFAADRANELIQDQ